MPRLSDAHRPLETYDPEEWLQNTGPMHNKRKRIWQQTFKIMQDGAYVDHDGNVTILDCKCTGTESRKYTEKPLLSAKRPRHTTEIEVLEADMLEVHHQLQDEGYNPCVLNVANDDHPGGGYEAGVGSLEEEFFRRSDYYNKLSKTLYPLKGAIVHTAPVIVFRGSEKHGYPLMAHPRKVGFVAVSAKQQTRYTKSNHGLRLIPKEEQILQNRIEALLRVAAFKGYDSMVLTALGCGTFNNPPHHVAELFMKMLHHEDISGRFKKVVFAIVDDNNTRKNHNPKGNLKPFQQLFGKHNDAQSPATAITTTTSSSPVEIDEVDDDVDAETEMQTVLSEGTEPASEPSSPSPAPPSVAAVVPVEATEPETDTQEQPEQKEQDDVNQANDTTTQERHTPPHRLHAPTPLDKLEVVPETPKESSSENDKLEGWTSAEKSGTTIDIIHTPKNGEAKESSESSNAETTPTTTSRETVLSPLTDAPPPTPLTATATSKKSNSFVTDSSLRTQQPTPRTVASSSAVTPRSKKTRSASPQKRGVVLHHASSKLHSPTVSSSQKQTQKVAKRSNTPPTTLRNKSPQLSRTKSPRLVNDAIDDNIRKQLTKSKHLVGKISEIHHSTVAKRSPSHTKKEAVSSSAMARSKSPPFSPASAHTTSRSPRLSKATTSSTSRPSGTQVQPPTTTPTRRTPSPMTLEGLIPGSPDYELRKQLIEKQQLINQLAERLTEQDKQFATVREACERERQAGIEARHKASKATEELAEAKGKLAEAKKNIAQIIARERDIRDESQAVKGECTEMRRKLKEDTVQNPYSILPGEKRRPVSPLSSDSRLNHSIRSAATPGGTPPSSPPSPPPATSDNLVRVNTSSPRTGGQSPGSEDEDNIVVSSDSGSESGLRPKKHDNTKEINVSKNRLESEPKVEPIARPTLQRDTGGSAPSLPTNAFHPESPRSPQSITTPSTAASIEYPHIHGNHNIVYSQPASTFGFPVSPLAGQSDQIQSNNSEHSTPSPQHMLPQPYSATSPNTVSPLISNVSPSQQWWTTGVPPESSGLQPPPGFVGSPTSPMVQQGADFRPIVPSVPVYHAQLDPQSPTIPLLHQNYTPTTGRTSSTGTAGSIRAVGGGTPPSTRSMLGTSPILELPVAQQRATLQQQLSPSPTGSLPTPSITNISDRPSQGSQQAPPALYAATLSGGTLALVDQLDHQYKVEQEYLERLERRREKEERERQEKERQIARLLQISPKQLGYTPEVIRNPSPTSTNTGTGSRHTSPQVVTRKGGSPGLTTPKIQRVLTDQERIKKQLGYTPRTTSPTQPQQQQRSSSASLRRSTSPGSAQKGPASTVGGSVRHSSPPARHVATNPGWQKRTSVSPPGRRATHHPSSPSTSFNRPTTTTPARSAPLKHTPTKVKNSPTKTALQQRVNRTNVSTGIPLSRNVCTTTPPLPPQQAIQSSSDRITGICDMENQDTGDMVLLEQKGDFLYALDTESPLLPPPPVLHAGVKNNVRGGSDVCAVQTAGGDQILVQQQGDYFYTFDESALGEADQPLLTNDNLTHVRDNDESKYPRTGDRRVTISPTLQTNVANFTTGGRGHSPVQPSGYSMPIVSSPHKRGPVPSMR